MTEKDGDAKFKAGIAFVQTQIAEQLNQAGRFTPEANKANAALVASFYGVTAAKVGVTPEQLFDRYPLRVQAQRVTGAGSQYDQYEGPFGPVLENFRGDAQGAIARLIEMKTGEAVGALTHPEIGDIDLVWGEEGTAASDGYGLAKLVRWHPEVLNDLQGVISAMRVVQRSGNRVKLESADHQASVRLTWNDQAKNWLLTAFEKRDAPGTTTDTAGTSGGDDTARPTDVSGLIVDQKIQRFYQAAAQQTSNNSDQERTESDEERSDDVAEGTQGDVPESVDDASTLKNVLKVAKSRILTSNGMKVGKNFELAEQAYVHYKQHGQMPTNIQAGQAQKAINESLALFNELKTEWGIDDLRRFMLTNFTVGEISAISKALKPGTTRREMRARQRLWEWLHQQRR
jgi:hypothetical protein